MRRISCCLFVAVGLAVFFGCGKSAKERELEETARKLEEATKKMEAAAEKGNLGEAMKQFGEAFMGGEKVETVDFRALEALLPESLPGMKRTEAKGQKHSALGINVSEAEGLYEDEQQGAGLSVKIGDIGNMSGMAALASYAWARADIDRKTEGGYEKTFTHRGYRAYEEYDSEMQEGQVSILVADRFVVEISGNGVKMEQLRAALGKIDLAKLGSLK